MFYTGSGRHSATTANVFCRIYGNHHKTKPIVLRDPDRPMFQSSSVSSFLVTLSRSLDQIREIHIWHDISGPDPPWYLESVIICHLNTDVTWYFEANRWLDVSTGSKEVECKLQPSQRKTFLEGKTLFDAKINDNLKNKHLWFSPFCANNRRTLNKFQKMSCCLAVAGIMALVATIVVEKTQTMFSNASIQLGPWKLKLGDIYRAILCSAIAFVVRLLLESLFFNCRRKRSLDIDERNVKEHIQDSFQKLNAITFVEENAAQDEVECCLSSQDETVSTKINIGGEKIDMTRSKELQMDMQDGVYLHENISGDPINKVREFVSDTSSTESEKNNHSSKGARNLGDLFDVLGNLPEKEKLMKILDNGNNDSVDVDYSIEQVKDKDTLSNSENVFTLDDDVLEFELKNLQPDKYTDNKNVEYQQESVSWTETVTSPDEIPKLWKQLPFPRHLIDDHSIKKLHIGTPKLPEIVLKVTQVQCFILPLLCTAVVLVIGIQWPVVIVTSWIMTFVIAVVCEIFVLETLYIFVNALYFAIWYRRPVKEEDLIHVLLTKVWVNDEQETTYYVDQVIDGEEGEEVPKPPSQEDIQKAQETAGRGRELEDVLKMLVFDVLFLMLLIFISFGNRDVSSYPTRVGIENSFNISKSFYGVILVLTSSSFYLDDGLFACIYVSMWLCYVSI